MTVGAGIRLINGKLLVSGECILTGVNDNVVLTPVSTEGPIDGAFIGVKSDQKGSRRVFPVGNLQGLRFLSLFRFKMWWMTQWTGTCGKEIPVETQFLIMESKNSSCLQPEGREGAEEEEHYIVFFPLLEGDFRAVLQGNEQNEIEICLESGDPAVDKFDGSRLVFIACGSNPFDLITDAVKTIEKHLQTFCHRERRTIPDMLNWFGWCTWDAFYTDVSAEGVKQGIESLMKGGIPPKFLIIDDGWQSVGMDPTGVEVKADDTANIADRLVDIKENHKFQEEGSVEESVDNSKSFRFRHLIAALKEKYGIRYVYAWHAITGYWGGVNPNVPAMKCYEPKLAEAIPSPGVESNGICYVLKGIILNKVGVVDPEKAYEFYNDLHEYLSSAGVDGVKVDAQTSLETLGASRGGRINLAQKYHKALEASVSKNFKDNNIISCMSHNTDTLYSSKKTAVIRASDDFFPRDPASHTVHIASVAYNSVFLGEFMQPDWDMFHSRHPMAEYHGAARAVGGCPVYVSDKPECHDFNLLRKLVLPDGSILRAKLPGRPTKDCLFSDPTRDRKSFGF
ncbi:probable galactinol--sucrose galactosyltransferase 1 isoform X2 [Punica granatum]|uniref:galactinol--sucrose galactosyltransferase n=1 Tax=Punica granatum TaxID=22663 RepID=A0A6P8EIZ7_PUNGR|nr:probable galactinol--sucrose galactosyltransferase 1 isoform X2 [Punica granatum]